MKQLEVVKLHKLSADLLIPSQQSFYVRVWVTRSDKEKQRVVFYDSAVAGVVDDETVDAPEVQFVLHAEDKEGEGGGERGEDHHEVEDHPFIVSDIDVSTTTAASSASSSSSTSSPPPPPVRFSIHRKEYADREKPNDVQKDTCVGVAQLFLHTIEDRDSTAVRGLALKAVKDPNGALSPGELQIRLLPESDDEASAGEEPGRGSADAGISKSESGPASTTRPGESRPGSLVQVTERDSKATIPKQQAGNTGVGDGGGAVEMISGGAIAPSNDTPSGAQAQRATVEKTRTPAVQPQTGPTAASPAAPKNVRTTTAGSTSSGSQAISAERSSKTNTAGGDKSNSNGAKRMPVAYDHEYRSGDIVVVNAVAVDDQVRNNRSGSSGRAGRKKSSPRRRRQKSEPMSTSESTSSSSSSEESDKDSKKKKSASKRKKKKKKNREKYNSASPSSININLIGQQIIRGSPTGRRIVSPVGRGGAPMRLMSEGQHVEDEEDESFDT
ncbi:unnamed protein product [Amoebophrya sp. A120]|nr:unnamed protein product [Amoebophrya sp. A120]|eukprot:GSA120T00015714001.1